MPARFGGAGEQLHGQRQDAGGAHDQRTASRFSGRCRVLRVPATKLGDNRTRGCFENRDRVQMNALRIHADPRRKCAGKQPDGKGTPRCCAMGRTQRGRRRPIGHAAKALQAWVGCTAHARPRGLLQSRQFEMPSRDKDAEEYAEHRYTRLRSLEPKWLLNSPKNIDKVHQGVGNF